MKIRYVFPIVSCMLLLTGCLVTSVYPFYTPKEVVFEPTLTGTWTNASAETQERWEFEAGKTNSYRLTYMSKTTNVMQATLFKLQGHSFLDLFTGEISEENQPPPIPSHFLFRVEHITPSLKMVPMDYEWLSKYLTENPKAVRHHRIPDDSGDPDKYRLVLTADTADLQKFIIKHLATADAWKEPTELKKAQSK